MIHVHDHIFPHRKIKIYIVPIFFKNLEEKPQKYGLGNFIPKKIFLQYFYGTPMIVTIN